MAIGTIKSVPEVDHVISIGLLSMFSSLLVLKIRVGVIRVNSCALRLDKDSDESEILIAFLPRSALLSIIPAA